MELTLLDVSVRAPELASALSGLQCLVVVQMEPTSDPVTNMHALSRHLQAALPARVRFVAAQKNTYVPPRDARLQLALWDADSQ